MTIEHITRKQAELLTGHRLPTGHNWYFATALQFYPDYGDLRYTVAGDEGLTAVIGKRKQAKLGREQVA